MSHLLELVRATRQSAARGIYSVCSAHPWVLEAAMRRHPASAGPLLIEATCNQVNQFGGYTGMRPADFRDLVHRIAAQVQFPVERILLGGDHLGPFPWQDLVSSTALTHACDLVSLYVREGYTKIHLDASMPCAEDARPLSPQQIAERAARLCSVAEAASSGQNRPVYIIGTEVPTPGGAAGAMDMPVTSPQDAEEALRVHREAFLAAGLEDAWQRVIALVVQPGVEFGNEHVEDYESSHAARLSAVLTTHGPLIFEAHSTDYQRPAALAALVRDGFAILKVGPGLTFAMRQAIFALAAIEEETVAESHQSRLREQVEHAMLEHPAQWAKHYPGTPQQQHRLRMHSYSDRIRYYWTQDNVQHAIHRLIANLSSMDLPETMLCDLLPLQYGRIREGRLQKSPLPIIFDAIGDALEPYIAACGS